MTEKILVPVWERIVIKISDVEEKTTGGILLPDKTRDKLRTAAARGEVLRVGEACEGWVKNLVGKTVLYGRYSGDEVTEHGDQKVFLCTEADILGVLVDGEEEISKIYGEKE